MNSSTKSAIIIGGGIIGCSIALELSLAGIRCALIDKGALNQEASTAAAGMLGAQVETHHPGPFYQLCRLSQALYREWSIKLLTIGGISPQYIAEGILRAALTPEDESELQSRLSWIEDAEWFSAREMRVREQAITPDVLGGLYLRRDHQVHPIHLAQSLTAALHKLDCEIREWTPALSLIERGGHIRGVRTTDGELFADHIILSAGAWGSALTEPFGLSLPLFPVKGQCISLKTAAPVIRSTVFFKECYVVPKEDGTMIVGATQEEAGFDKRCHASVIGSLHTSASRLIPELEHAEFVRTWAGLRPGTRDGLPYIGRPAALPGLITATGHYRNGILLAPATGRLIKQLVLDEQPDMDLGAFAPDRVRSAAEHLM
ncbi:glycine oxidase ThiO [Paenibacillus xerothermodurans]|uniref:glycine oxidase n=1 Tax=Paenibacillus xerothermodurans TaxID=1977292 RepID=A0A2W1N8S4_PAEXE|nr:glycine oxidase ThiO [Paenibacillus xerothermodurans]PZE21019.1 glycine oxidase ThiO [Paenibacillus xerothermodurans]